MLIDEIPVWASPVEVGRDWRDCLFRGHDDINEHLFIYYIYNSRLSNPPIPPQMEEPKAGYNHFTEHTIKSL